MFHSRWNLVRFAASCAMCLLVLLGCAQQTQPQTVLVVTATPPPATQTPVVLVVTSTLLSTSPTPSLTSPPSATPVSPTGTSQALEPAAPNLSTVPAATEPATPNLPTVPVATEPAAGPTNTAKPVAPSGPVGILAYTVTNGPGNTVPEVHSIWVANVDGSGAHKILDKARWPSLTPDGTQVLFFNMNSDLDYYNLDGSRRQVFIGEQFSYGAAQSPDMKWVAIVVNPGRAVLGNFFIDLVTNTAQNRHKLIEGFHFSWSPDSTRVVYGGCAPGGNPCGIFIIPISGGNSQLLTGDSAGTPAWCRNDRIAFHRDVSGVKQIFVINADGSGERQLTFGTNIHASPSWDRTCNYIIYRSPASGSWGIWVMRADGSGQRQIIANVGVDDLWWTEPVSVH
jgi:Tol biopolymer transport system component